MTFKEYLNFTDRCIWYQSSFLPGEGRQAATYEPPKDYAFQNALGVILRGYPFDNPGKRLRLSLLVDQTSNRLTLIAPIPAWVSYRGREVVDLPFGRVEAHHLQVIPDRGKVHYDYWFASDAQLPMLGVMVQYQSSDGTSYRLAALQRRPAQPE